MAPVAAPNPSVQAEAFGNERVSPRANACRVQRTFDSISDCVCGALDRLTRRLRRTSNFLCERLGGADDVCGRQRVRRTVT